MVRRVSTVAFEDIDAHAVDVHIKVSAVTATDLTLPPPSEDSREVAARDI